MTKEEVFDLLQFDAAERGRVLQGEIVSRDFKELSDKELSVSLAMVVPVPMDRLLADLRSGKVLEHDRQLLSYGIIHDEKTLDRDLAGVAFTSDEAGEIDKLLAARPGSEFNLSVEELGRFDALRRRRSGAGCSKEPSCADEVISVYRGILKDRIESYRARGLAGIEPYSRGNGPTADPRQELRTAMSDLKVLTERMPMTMRAFAEYPQGDQSALEQWVVWLKQRVQDRPTFVLSHRCLHVLPPVAFLAERQFYVEQSYNSLQIIAGLFPMESKTLVFYLNRTSTDQVAGFMKATRHGMGRKIMAKEIRAHFEQLREALSK
ncbi:MAG TPA: hypothetical protein VFG76_13925 [Candidatus Polarisedimenticolia bacterium]|nr:hypothetical protein [Candidatus Polarisedimenticolia bacterium]